MLSTQAMSTLALGLAYYSQSTQASPLVPSLGSCFKVGGPQLQYSVDKTEHNIVDPPAITGEWSCGGTGGTCTNNVQSSYTVGVTVEVGIDIGLEFAKIAGEAGISASVATTTETGTVQGTGKNCPDGSWVCSLIIKPRMTRVSGIATPLDAQCIPLKDKSKPYSVVMAETGADGLTGGFADICACKNRLHWADNGAPSIVCPQDCSN